MWKLRHQRLSDFPQITQPLNAKPKDSALGMADSKVFVRSTTLCPLLVINVKWESWVSEQLSDLILALQTEATGKGLTYFLFPFTDFSLLCRGQYFIELKEFGESLLCARCCNDLWWYKENELPALREFTIWVWGVISINSQWQML